MHRYLRIYRIYAEVRNSCLRLQLSNEQSEVETSSPGCNVIIACIYRYYRPMR